MSQTDTNTPDPNAAPPADPPSGADTSGQPPADPPTPDNSAGGDILDNPPADDAGSEPAGDLLSDDGNTQPEGVPDSYTFELPEGLDPEAIDEAKLEAFKEVAKDLEVTQTQFQKLLEYDLERTQAAQQEAVDQWNERVDGWRGAARTDKEVGGENFDAARRVAMKTVETFGDAELKALMRSPSKDNPEGLAIGNHPAVLRFLHRIGTRLGDPSLVQGDGQQQSATDTDRLKKMYPSMFKD